MKIWSNTKTLDGYLPALSFTTTKGEADVALIGGKSIDLNEFPRLRGIFKTGIGRDNVPEKEAAARGIVCAFPSERTAQIIYEETANFACHAVLQCMYADTGDFSSWTKRDRAALSTRELLVVGAGNIGSRVAAKMKSFMKVSTFDVVTDAADALEPRLRRADCVSLHIPLNDTTRGLIDAKKLGWMKDGASLVNTARGAVVDEESLYEELKAGRLRAAFDVFWEEPYRGRLLDLPETRFVRSPHVASTCAEFLQATARDFIDFMDSR